MRDRTRRACSSRHQGEPTNITSNGSTRPSRLGSNWQLASTIAYSNTFGATVDEQFNNAEIFLIDPDGSNPRRLTDNHATDAFPTLSPNGKKIVFDSNRLRGTGPLNTSDLFVMNTDGTEQTHLIRASSPTWSPDSKHIAFHASASGTGLPILTTPGSATIDSDLFIANVDDLVRDRSAAQRDQHARLHRR